MPKPAAAVLNFQANAYPEKQTLFEALADGQSPEALFITCADSRTETAIITHHLHRKDVSSVAKLADEAKCVAW
ncbi:MAG: hypothetical protein AAF683_03115 [Pseudomonadota bacterium]